MAEKLTRRAFLSKCCKSTAVAITLTACGKLTPFAFAQDSQEIQVDETGLITSIDVLNEQKVIPFVYKGKKSILLFNDGEYRAFENICTHKGGPTKFSTDKLVCKWHGATFDPLTGESLTRPAPAKSKLTEIKLKIEVNDIYVAQEDVAALK
ncbi:MAG: Rieske (2Fe-2S) protein [Candidatus Omnitrophica bacterium]|nr:Rieske (2Fe-2S) protein [Candidatus Omnitrophota bacterium]MBU1997047.1 Rieske (2Fe-2S) protein [Candidatus Omnitrophota bacterium]MBU4334750.1 Rieske (2Fe-2S) protein [Candidatus Omnitrophota bacterium]